MYKIFIGRITVDFNLPEEALSQLRTIFKKGWTIYQLLKSFMRKINLDSGYKEINTPEILDRGLWEKSGHWEKFGENMYTSTTPDEKIFAIKPLDNIYSKFKIAIPNI